MGRGAAIAGLERRMQTGAAYTVPCLAAAVKVLTHDGGGGCILKHVIQHKLQ